MLLGGTLTLSLPQLIGDPPPGQMQQPGLERTESGIGFELGNFLRDRDDRFLDDLLRLDVRHARFYRHSVNQLPIRVEKIPPTLLVVAILHPAQKAVPRRNEVIRAVIHNS